MGQTQHGQSFASSTEIAASAARMTGSVTIPWASLEATIAACRTRLEAHPTHPTRFCVSASAAPTIAERTALSYAVARLEAQLEPCDDRVAIEVLVSEFLIGFELGNGQSELNTEALNLRFVKGLAGLPLGAIKAAIDRYDAGKPLIREGWRAAFRPTPAQLAEETRAGMVPLRAKLLHARQVLEAEVYEPATPEQKAELAKAAEAYRLQLMPTSDPVQRGPQHLPEELFEARLREDLAALKSVGRDPAIGRLMANLDGRARA